MLLYLVHEKAKVVFFSNLLHGQPPNGSRMYRVYCGADGAAGRRVRDCELVGTCYASLRSGERTRTDERGTARDDTTRIAPERRQSITGCAWGTTRIAKQQCC